MAIINKDGKLVITVSNPDDAAQDLLFRRNTLYNLLQAHTEPDPDDIYYGIEMLKDMDLSLEQLQRALNKTKH